MCIRDRFHKDGDEGHAFNQGGQRNGNHHDGGGGSRVAPGGFRGFRADEADAEAGADGDEMCIRDSIKAMQNSSCDSWSGWC